MRSLFDVELPGGEAMVVAVRDVSDLQQRVLSGSSPQRVSDAFLRTNLPQMTSCGSVVDVKIQTGQSAVSS